MNRREFGRDLLAGAMASPIALGNQVAKSDMVQDPASPSIEDQLVAILRSQFGDRLGEEQWKQIRAKISGQLAAAKLLRDFKLLNSDEPATLFAVHKPS